MIEIIKEMAHLIKQQFNDVFIEIPSDRIIPNDAGDLIIHVFNVPDDRKREFMKYTYNIEVEYLWPKDIYEVVFLPHTVTNTQKYHLYRIPESEKDVRFFGLPQITNQKWSLINMSETGKMILSDTFNYFDFSYTIELDCMYYEPTGTYKQTHGERTDDTDESYEKAA